jgi:hypothetical protein
MKMMGREKEGFGEREREREMKRRVMKHSWKRRERNLYEGSGRRRDSWLGKQWRESRELKPERLEWNKNRIR